MVLLLSDTVMELCSSQHLIASIVVAGDSTSDPSEVLEALLLLGDHVVIAAQLGHLDLELVID